MTLYTAEWLAQQEWTREWVERAFLTACVHLGIPGTLTDMGCGAGYAVEMAASLDVLAHGYDIACENTLYTTPRDLTVAFEPLRSELVLSWEVGEHLPPEAAETYVDNVVRAMADGGSLNPTFRDPGSWLVFTAAPPGQEGEGHVNCQPQEFWRELIEARGPIYDLEITERIRETWRWATGPCFWYPQNVQVFRKGA
jgi:hypothetical protein